MAKSDSFFIRARIPYNGTTFAETSIDLGAYVDALGKSVLRIHNMKIAWGDPLDVIGDSAAAGVDVVNAMQLTTQSQSAMVDLTNKSVIASGSLQAVVDAGGTSTDLVTELVDIAPQDWTNGYLVGVEQIYLGVDCTHSGANGLTACSIVLECTVETLSQSAAMALALSQQ